MFVKCRGERVERTSSPTWRGLRKNYPCTAKACGLQELEPGASRLREGTLATGPSLLVQQQRCAGHQGWPAAPPCPVSKAGCLQRGPSLPQPLTVQQGVWKRWCANSASSSCSADMVHGCSPVQRLGQATLQRGAPETSRTGRTGWTAGQGGKGLCSVTSGTPHSYLGKKYSLLLTS